MDAPPEPPAVRALSNRMNRALIAALENGPSYPRRLAQEVGASEGQVQKHLHALAAAGIVDSAWHHDGKTVKLYRLRAAGIRVEFQSGITARPVAIPGPAVGPAFDRARP